eukprot:6213681-Pleurochrysis_carterae.AAC.7
MPACTRAPMRRARASSRESTAAASPKSVPFARRIASASVLNVAHASTGPKTSVRQMECFSGSTQSTVGSYQYPLGLDAGRLPPVSSVAPSDTAALTIAATLSR